MNWINKHQSGAVVYNADGTVAGTQRGNYLDTNEKPKGITVTAPSVSQGLKGIGSMVSQGMQTKAPPQAPTQAPTGFYYNNVPVSEADYRRLTATPTPVPQQAQVPAAITNAGGSPIADLILKQAQEQKANADRLRGQIEARSNPYGTDTEGYRRGLNAAQNTLVGQQNRNQALAAGRIGGLASGLRGAQNQAMQNDARAAFAGVEAQMYGAERDRATAFENERDRALMMLNAGDYSGSSAILGSLMRTGLDQFNADRGYGIDMDRLDLARNQDAREQSMFEIQRQYEPVMAELRLNDARVRQMLLEGEAEAAKGRQAEEMWKQKNSWWLGPLSGYVNFISNVAGAAARGGA